MKDGSLAILGGTKAVTVPGPKWPAIGEEEIAAVTEGLGQVGEDTRYLTAPAGGGPVEALEKGFAEYMGADFALSMSGGGPALHTAVMASGAKAGDEIIVSPYTWGQTVSCILQHNCIPVFADIDPETYNIDPASIAQCITSHTRAIVVVHIFGNPADMDAILDIAQRHNLIVIEDCAQAVGSKYNGRYVGTFGDFGCFSIGSGKNMVGGEGGMILTNSHRRFQEALLYGHHPVRHNKELVDEDLKALSDNLIYTYRMHPACAMIAGVQLNYLDEWNADRRKNSEYLSEALREFPGIHPPEVLPENEHIYHIYSSTFEPEEVAGVSRETYVKALTAEGVPVGLGYVRRPIHLRRTFQEREYFSGRGLPWSMGHRDVSYTEGDCPVAEDLCANRELTIGGSVAWRGDQSGLIEHYIEAFRKVTVNLDVLRKAEASDQIPEEESPI